ncbi:MAG: hypothetical protein ACLFVQ_06990 [Chitinispirillaceae bacterium]
MPAPIKKQFFAFFFLSMLLPLAIAGQEDEGSLYYFNPEAITTLKGTVADYDSLLFYDGTESFTHILLKTSDGQIVFIVLGPEYFLGSNNISFRKGDEVEVTGSVVGQGEKSFIIATSVMKGNQHLELRNKEGIPLWLEEYMRFHE